MIYYVFNYHRTKAIYEESIFLKNYKKFKVVQVLFDDFGNEIRYVE